MEFRRAIAIRVLELDLSSFSLCGVVCGSEEVRPLQGWIGGTGGVDVASGWFVAVPGGGDLST